MVQTRGSNKDLQKELPDDIHEFSRSIIDNNRNKELAGWMD